LGIRPAAECGSQNTEVMLSFAASLDAKRTSKNLGR
jgi:hypothetical protein